MIFIYFLPGEYCGEPHASIVGLHQHLLEDHPQQVQEERELLAKVVFCRFTHKLVITNGCFRTRLRNWRRR